MADGNDDPRDDLPGPAYESCEAAELACPAERSGHVAVGDGRHMFVWGGYKVSGARRADQRGRLRAPRLALGFPPGVPCVWESPLEPGARAQAPGLLSRRRRPRRPRPPCCSRRPGCWTSGRYWGEGTLGGA